MAIDVNRLNFKTFAQLRPFLDGKPAPEFARLAPTRANAKRVEDKGIAQLAQTLCSKRKGKKNPTA